MPGGRATEELAITHGKELCRAVRRAQRIGPDTSLGRLIDQRHELLPLIRFACCLAQVVVHHGAACGFRGTRDQVEQALVGVGLAEQVDRLVREQLPGEVDTVGLGQVVPEAREDDAVQGDANLIPPRAA